MFATLANRLPGAYKAAPPIRTFRHDRLGGSFDTAPGNRTGPPYPMSTAYPGLMMSSMIRNRSGNGMNADFMALMVNRSRSLQP